MATYAIGDIQGCFLEFEQLLDRLSFEPSRDRLWLVGDLVNRGPQSLQVLRKVQALGEAAITVLGNHDLHLLALAAAPQRRSKATDTLAAVLAAPDRAQLLDWLRRQPLLHHDPALGYTMIHAGLPPQWDLATARDCARQVEMVLRDAEQGRALLAAMYGDNPDRWSPELHGMERLRFITNCFTRLRYCRTDGTLELRFKGAPQDAPAGIMPWFRVPGRRSRTARIVCGHWSALGYHDEDGVLSIDTGCVWGRRLCAVRLDRRAAPQFIACRSAAASLGED